MPSVGGTVSIFTKSAERAQGGSFTQLLGNDGYSKSTIAYNTGLNQMAGQHLYYYQNGLETDIFIIQWEQGLPTSLL